MAPREIEAEQKVATAPRCWGENCLPMLNREYGPFIEFFLSENVLGRKGE